MAVLVTGGTGYIGSHICVEILKNEKDVVIIDNLSNSKKEVVEQIQNITQKKVTFYPGDVRNVSLLNHILKNHKIESCIHLAGLKYPEESVKKPLNYYQINLTSTLYLLQALKN
ncbi:MAG: SDR family NAD(P)-dependent oxidoreductase, partial [Lachnospiraceae bacterium]|nr:SDR family NAD(P)-dependent oxidoreductase [Lachnospiraceae bacterium]